MRTLTRAGLWGTVVLGLAAGAARADGIAADRGVEARSGAKIRTAITPAGDVDDAHFLGLPGQRVRAVLRGEAKGDEPELTARLSLLDPAGEELWSETGTKLRLDVTLTSTGVHTLRVEGTEEGAIGRYRLDVKHTSPPKAKDKRNGGESGEVTFDVTAGPGVEIGFVLSWKRGELTFAGIDDPDGAPVPLLEAGVTPKKKKLRLAPTRLPAGSPAGTYRVRCTSSAEAPAERLRFVPKTRLERLRGRARKLDLAATEPQLVLVPAGAVPGERIAFLTQNPLDPDEESLPRVFLSGRELLSADLPSPQTVTALVPADFPLGVYRLTIRTRTGQVATWAEDVEIRRRPRVTGTEPDRGPEQGGFEVELTGTDFPPVDRIGVTLNGFTLSADAVIESGPGRVLFRAPARNPGGVSFGVIDRPSFIGSRTGPWNFTFQDVPALDAVEPSITPVLGGGSIVLRGAGFEAADRVLLERPDGSLETFTNTFVSDTSHRFTAPARPPGVYVVVVEDSEGLRNPIRREIRYFRFADVTAAAGLDDVAGDVLDAVTSTTVDYDRDDDLDLILCAAGGDSVSARSLTRVLRNDDGVFTDVTLDVLPPVTSTEDWRAHAVSTADVDGDGWPDLFLASNHLGVLSATSSHLRVLRNVTPQPAVPGARAFADVTTDWMQTPRTMQSFIFSQDPPEIRDRWRAQDLWVGDLDGDGGVPDIVIVHDEVKSEPNVQCGNYCTSPLGASATYNFYWGGTRVFSWDETERDGLGRFRFRHDAMPRRSGVGVPISLAPPGVPIPGCSVPCLGKFTPFTGERLVVADLDGDGQKDIAVVDSRVVEVNDEEVSSLQVALQGFDAQRGAEFTDVTEALTVLGGSFRARSVAFGKLQGRDARGVLAVTSPSAPADGTRAMRLVRYVDPQGGSGVRAVFEDLTSLLPPVDSGDALQADALHTFDVDGNGRDDLVLLSSDTAPLGGAPGLRLVLSIPRPDGTIRLAPSWSDLLTPLLGSDEDLDGDTLTIGDLAGESLPTFVLSRASATGAPSATRAIRMTTDD